MNISLLQLRNSLEQFVDRLTPRILTQVCRDPNSAHFGVFDRNWWHYKIRDFPSIILQQGGYTLGLLSQLPAFSSQSEFFKRLAEAGGIFWNHRAQKRGAFEEYYPWENGYPPLAFSTLAIAKLVNHGWVAKHKVTKGLHIATHQLLTRFEGEAANQQVAGLAALAWIANIEPSWVSSERFSALTAKVLSLQDSEGWFYEYGGPDLGYLSVTLDCLWDLYDATHDSLFLQSAEKALEFIKHFIYLPSKGAGMHNARNTDYIVPYGIARFLITEGKNADLAYTILTTILNDLDAPSHFLQAIDDRYFCHYIGHSLVRTLQLLNRTMHEKKYQFINPSLRSVILKNCGYYINHTQNGYSVLVSTKKGGSLSIWNGDKFVANYGWIVKYKKQLWCSAWWNNEWKVDWQNNQIRVTGYLVPCRNVVSTPSKHIVLRILSGLFGNKIIRWLKEKMIFKTNFTKKFAFERTINFHENSVEVFDKITGIADLIILPAPRTSQRHVASADSFHHEDISLNKNIDIGISEIQSKDNVELTTNYVFSVLNINDIENVNLQQ
jgi:hypothetical protein